MGLLLRPDAYCAQTPDGAYVLTHEGESAFTGRSVYQLIDRLTPFLDGRHSLAELTADLPAERRQMVRELITTLIERGAVRDVDRGGAPGAGPAGHQHEVAFAGYFLDSPGPAFREYQDTVTLVIGAGRLGRAVAVAAARSGLRQVRVVTTAECPADLERPGAAGDGWRGDRQRLAGDLTHEEARNAIGSLLEGVDLVLHASDRPMVERARLLDQLGQEAGVPIAQTLVLDDHAWIASAGLGGRAGVSWTSGWRRLQARRRPDATRRPARDDALPPVAPDELSATAVASQLVHGVFQAITLPAGATKDAMTRVELATLDSAACAYLPHPFAVPAFATSGTDFADRIARLSAGARLDEQTFSRRAVACAGDQVGVFGDPAEREFAQIPLHVCEIEVSDPVGLLDPARPAPKVTGAGLDFATARYQAALKAFASYASLMIDPRRLNTIGDRRADSRTDPDTMLSALKSGQVTGLVQGYGVADGGTHLVDVSRVFPALRAPASPPASPYVPPPGVAAAYDWREAVIRGMVGQCLRLTLGDLAMSARPYPRVDLAGAALDARGDRYRALLAAIGEPVTVYDVTGPLGVPTMVGYLGSVAAGCASSPSAVGALTDALEQVLVHYQARENDQPDYAPAPIRDIPDRLRGTTTGPLSGEPARDGTVLAAALAQRGHRPIAIPLDHDPEVGAIMPYIVHVVITNA